MYCLSFQLYRLCFLKCVHCLLCWFLPSTKSQLMLPLLLDGILHRQLNMELPKCPKNCSSCVNFTKCKACINGYFLNLDFMCKADCSARTYPGKNTWTCLLCQFDCYTCNNKIKCLSCNSTVDFR